MTTTTVYSVGGMSCQHCVAAVTGELAALAGVQQVEVDLSAGVVAVTSVVAPDLTAVRRAVDDAGYELLDEP